MKDLEIIKKILEEDNTVNIFELLSNTNNVNLIKLCVLNDKYLTEENLDSIIKESMPNPKLAKIKDTFDRIIYTDKYRNIINLIIKYPIIEKIPSKIIDQFDEHDWVSIISNKPYLLKHCKIIKKFKEEDWVNILVEQPSLIEKVNIIHDLSPENWVYLIKKRPQLTEYCNKFDEFSNNNWYELLSAIPNLANKCHIALEEDEVIDLLIKYPILIKKLNIENIGEFNHKTETMMYNSKKYHIDFMKKYTEIFTTPEILTNMIGIYPDLKGLYSERNLWKYVDFSKLTENIEYAILK